MSHIVVIGYNGFIGKHITGLLTSMPGVDQLSLLGRDHVQVISGNEEYKQSYSTWLSATANINITSLIYLAWDSTPYSSLKGGDTEGNLKICQSYLADLSKHQIEQFIFISSAGAMYRAGHEVLFDETSTTKNQSPYAEEKFKTEAFLEHWAKAKISSLVILRPSNIYGPGQTLKRGMGIIPVLFEHVKKHQKINLYEPLDSSRDYLYIDDFIEAMKYCLAKRVPAGTYNLAAERLTSLQTLIDEVGRATSKTIHFDVDIQMSPNYASISAQRFKKTCGWSAKVDIRDGISIIWQDYHESS